VTLVHASTPPPPPVSAPWLLGALQPPTLGPVLKSTYRAQVVRVGPRSVHMHLWDSSGEERFKSLTKAFFRGAVGGAWEVCLPLGA
jgi:hypothetical protein